MCVHVCVCVWCVHCVCVCVCVCALCMCVCVCVCVCVFARARIVWKVELWCFTWFLQIFCSTGCIFIQKDFYTICARCFECVAGYLCVCSCVICEFLQGRCSRHVTCMGVRRHGGNDIAEWVITEYRLITFSLTQTIYTSTFFFQFVYIVFLFNHNSATSVSCQLLQWWLYSTQPLDQSGRDLIYKNNNIPILGLPGCTEHIFVVWEFFHSSIHSFGMRRMWRFFAVLGSLFHSSLLYTLSFHPFARTSRLSCLTSSCHLFHGLPLSLVSKFMYNTFLEILFQSHAYSCSVPYLLRLLAVLLHSDLILTTVSYSCLLHSDLMLTVVS